LKSMLSFTSMANKFQVLIWPIHWMNVPWLQMESLSWDKNRNLLGAHLLKTKDSLGRMRNFRCGILLWLVDNWTTCFLVSSWKKGMCLTFLSLMNMSSMMEQNQWFMVLFHELLGKQLGLRCRATKMVLMWSFTQKSHWTSAISQLISSSLWKAERLEQEYMINLIWCHMQHPIWQMN